MKDIYILTDYKNYFESNYDSKPYRSGFDHESLIKLFREKGYSATIIKMVDVLEAQIDWKGKLVLYTSNEEPGYEYKSFIEDVVLFLKEKGAVLLPKYELLRANNNKSFMELYKVAILEGTEFLQARVYGCLEDLLSQIDRIRYPVVFKPSEGSMSSGVALAKSKAELLGLVKKYAKTSNLRSWLKEMVRQRKFLGYVKNSYYQKKFILQPYIPNLENDWKVLIFGEKVYVLRRGVRKNDFRASGSHLGYKAGSKSGFPVDHLDRLLDFKNKIGLPSISIDYTFDGKNGYIIEFQGIYFGLSTHNYSDDYYQRVDGKWEVKANTLSKDELFVYSVIHHLGE